MVWTRNKNGGDGVGKRMFGNELTGVRKMGRRRERNSGV